MISDVVKDLSGDVLSPEEYFADAKKRLSASANPVVRRFDCKATYRIMGSESLRALDGGEWQRALHLLRQESTLDDEPPGEADVRHICLIPDPVDQQMWLHLHRLAARSNAVTTLPVAEMRVELGTSLPRHDYWSLDEECAYLLEYSEQGSLQSVQLTTNNHTLTKWIHWFEQQRERAGALSELPLSLEMPTLDEIEVRRQQLRGPLRIKAIRYNSGDRVEVSNSDVVLVIGPNSSGKTRSLMDLRGLIEQAQCDEVESNNTNSGTFALSGIEMQCPLTTDEIQDWIRQHRVIHEVQNETRVETPGTGAPVRPLPSGHTFRGRLGDWTSHFVSFMDARARLTSPSWPQRPDIGQRLDPSSPVAAVFNDLELCKDIADAVHGAFGLHLLRDGHGTHWRLRLSEDQTQDDFTSTTTDGQPDELLAKRLSFIDCLACDLVAISFARIIRRSSRSTSHKSRRRRTWQM